MGGKFRLFVAGASVAALGLVISLVSVSAASPGVTRLHVVEHADTDTVVDTDGDAADSTGDLLTFHNEVFDDSDTVSVGTDQGECVRIEVGVSWECRWVNFVEGGSITVEGPFFDAGPSTMAITGGTGVYRGARGTMRLAAANQAATEYDFVFRILNG